LYRVGHIRISIYTMGRIYELYNVIYWVGGGMQYTMSNSYNITSSYMYDENTHIFIVYLETIYGDLLVTF
jgi:hypothetical protein